MTDTTPEAVAAALEGVTPAPWLVEYEGGTMRLMMGDDCEMCDETYYPWTPKNERDWHFIAWARNNVEALAADRDAQKARADAAEAETNKVRRFLKISRDEGGEALARAAAADAKVARLVEALEFYADRSLDGYDVQVTDYGLSTERGAILQDGGDIARAAIKEVQG